MFLLIVRIAIFRLNHLSLVVASRSYIFYLCDDPGEEQNIPDMLKLEKYLNTNDLKNNMRIFQIRVDYHCKLSVVPMQAFVCGDNNFKSTKRKQLSILKVNVKR